MGRGDSKRKRNNRALRAAAEKKVCNYSEYITSISIQLSDKNRLAWFPFPQNLDPAILLDKGKAPKKKKRTDEDMPASLRKMLQLKAAAEGKPRPDFRPALTLPSKPDSQKNQTWTE